MNIGERIKQKRIEKGWSQRDLAAKMNYSNHSTIGKIETGKVDIPQSRIVQFAEVLNTSVAFLMDWEQKETVTNDSNGLSESKRQLLALAESCSEEEADKLLQMMQILLGKQ